MDTKTSLTAQEIISTLPKLNHSDLEKVHAVTGSLMGPSGYASMGGTLSPDIFDALGHAIGLSTTFDMLPMNLTKKLHQEMPGFIKFLDTNFEGWGRNYISQTAFLRFLFELLRDDLRRMKLKVTYTTMINNLNRMPRVVDMAFPDYLNSGLGYVILARFQNGTNRQERANP